MRVFLARLLSLLLAFAAVATPLTATPIQAQATAGVDPTSGTVGTTFTFYADGLGATEEVDYWIIGPGSPEPFERGRLRVNLADGQRFSWPWTAPAGVWNGTWTWSVRGVQSEGAATVSFSISGASGAVVNSGVEPPNGVAGTEFVFYTDGWPEGDVVDYWVIAPGREGAFALGRIYGDPDENGFTRWRWKAPRDIWQGTWTMNARGFYSQVFVQIPFTLDGPPPPPPPTAGVTPQQARPGTTLSFSASGFSGGEEIAWWANAPGVLEPVARNGIDELFADAQGFVRFEWTVPANAASGQWSMVVRGVESGVQHQILFEVTGGTDAPTPSGGPQVTMTPQSGPPGTTFSFLASGFRRKETIQYWATGPDRQVVSDNQQIIASVDGEAEWQWTTPADIAPGQWVMSIQGPGSDVLITLPFEISGEARPADPGITVSPPSGAPGTTFSFSATGFNNQEKLGWWLTTPNGTVVAGDDDAQATVEGRYAWSWTAPADAQGGRWQAVVRGKTSGTERIVGFVLEGGGAAPTGGPLGSVSPERGAPGTTFSFTASGLTPSQQMGFWVDGPDGQRYPGDRNLSVSREGSLSWNWAAPTDAAPGSYVMIAESKAGGRNTGTDSLRIEFLVLP
jgi:hypothetical protein